MVDSRSNLVPPGSGEPYERDTPLNLLCFSVHFGWPVRSPAADRPSDCRDDEQRRRVRVLRESGRAVELCERQWRCTAVSEARPQWN